MTTLTDALTAHAADVLGATVPDLAASFAARGVHAFVPHPPELVAQYVADRDHYSGGFCARPDCARFVTASVHTAVEVA